MSHHIDNINRSIYVVYGHNGCSFWARGQGADESVYSLRTRRRPETGNWVPHSHTTVMAYISAPGIRLTTPYPIILFALTIIHDLIRDLYSRVIATFFSACGTRIPAWIMDLESVAIVLYSGFHIAHLDLKLGVGDNITDLAGA